MACPSPVIRQFHVQRHEKPGLVCVECGKVFRTAKDLRGHSEIHNQVEVVCPECGIGFKSRGVYRSHRFARLPSPLPFM